MLDYLLPGQGVGILRTRAPQLAEGGVSVHAPACVTVYWNGRAYAAEDGAAHIPSSALRARNTVRIVTKGGSYRCEGVAYDGACVSPLGYDKDALLLSMAESLTAALATLDDLAAWVLAERRRREDPLFI